MSNTRLRRLAVAGWLLAALAVATGDRPAQGQKDKGRKATFEVYKDKGGAFRWRYVASNGTVMARSEQSFKAKDSAVSSITSIQKGVGGGKLKDDFYQDKKKEYRWRLKASNDQVLAISTDGYKRKDGATSALAAFKKGAKDAEVKALKAGEK